MIRYYDAKTGWTDQAGTGDAESDIQNTLESIREDGKTIILAEYRQARDALSQQSSKIVIIGMCDGEMFALIATE